MNQELHRKLTKVFADDNEQYVKRTVLYASADAAHVTIDEKHTVELDMDTLLDLALKGIVIKVDKKFYVPTIIEETSGYITITCAADGTAKTFYSSEQA